MSRKAIIETNPEVAEEILKIVGRGHHPRVAAQSVGVTERSYWSWLKRGKEDSLANRETAFSSFFSGVARALAAAEIYHGDRLMDGDSFGPGETAGGLTPAKASLEVCRRRFSKNWGDRVSVKVEAELGRMLGIVEGICSEKDFEAICEAISAWDSPEEAGGDSGEALDS